jgi:hypothetical protein
MKRAQVGSLATPVTLGHPGTVKRLPVTRRGIIDSEVTDLICAHMHYVQYHLECLSQSKPQDSPPG